MIELATLIVLTFFYWLLFVQPNKPENRYQEVLKSISALDWELHFCTPTFKGHTYVLRRKPQIIAEKKALLEELNELEVKLGYKHA